MAGKESDGFCGTTEKGDKDLDRGQTVEFTDSYLSLMLKIYTKPDTSLE